MASPDVLLGAGLYETVRVSDGAALHGERHLARITASAHALGLPAPGRAAFVAAITGAAGAARWCACGCTPEPMPPSSPASAARRSHPIRCASRCSEGGTRPATCSGSTSSRAISTASRGGASRRRRGSTTHCSSRTRGAPASPRTPTSPCWPAAARHATGRRAAARRLPRGAARCRAALGLAAEARPVALAELIDAEAVLPHVLAARRQRGRRAGRPRAGRCAPACSQRCATAWPRLRGSTRWRYREPVSPALAAGARVLADVIPARGIEPAAALHALAGPGSALLESGEGRWSYLAPWPAAVLSRRDPAGALEEARVLLDRLAADVPAGAPPFTGGLLGSLGYDLARALERIPQHARDDLALPSIQLAAVDSLYAFDRERDEVWLSPVRSASSAGCARGSLASVLWRGRRPRGTSSAACRMRTTARASSGCSTTSPAVTSTRSTTRSGSRETVPMARSLRAPARDGARAVQPLPRRRRLAARRCDARDVPARERRRALRDAPDQGHAPA